MSTEQQNTFSGWAIVEMMGHRREIGYVTTEHYGAASLFRIDAPELPEREWTLEQPEYLRTEQGYKTLPAGSVVKRPLLTGRSCLVGPGSIYALNPCTEEAARLAIERSVERPVAIVSVPERAQLVAAPVIEEALPNKPIRALNC